MKLTPEYKRYFFLLGGRDLEMVEIRRLLEGLGLHEGEDFLDRELSWGARLSDYEGAFHPDRINVCLELREDIPPPERYLRIDHHNELPSRPAAIEQILGILQLKPTRWQELVAANDAGYIPALRAMGASREEIETVRRQDRACQGVTAQDEQQATRAIQEHLEVVNGVAVVQAANSKFSPITDRLFEQFEKILIFTNDELAYYGKNKSRLEVHFASLMEKGLAYSGGGSNGFWGVASKGLSKEEILKLTKLIPEIV